MDAKPQKPSRGFRVHGDENALPTLPGNKALHSRNKSSPALSTMVTAAINRMPLKRTAFHDVSNTAQGNRLAKDDSVIAGKVALGDAKALNIPQQKTDLKASAALLRPAQRPLPSLNESKNSVAINQKATASAAPLQKQQLPEANIQAASTANLRKILNKRNTTIFKDPATQPTHNNIESSKPTDHHVAKPRQHSMASATLDNKPFQHQVRRVQSTYSVLPTAAEQVKLIEQPPVHLPNLPTDEPKPTTQQLDREYRPESDAQLASLLARVETNDPAPITESHYFPVNEYMPAPAPAPAPAPQVGEVEPRVALPGEPEEYWDEEDEENYDEEGYVTARSFKSTTENVTGNATQAIVIPKTNNKARKEIEAARILVESMKTPEEIEDEAWDPTMVAEYGEEIFEYMRQLETKMQPNPHYMDLQTEIQWSMRSVLMDWLVQVHHRFQLLPETLFLCVNYIDRFLSYKVVSLGKLQLVGATAIFVAAKYEEINCPSVSEIVYMVDNGYSVDEILKAERFMLSMLQFELGWPGPMSFLRRISKADDYDLETRTLAKYFLEVTIMDERFLGCPPSFTAAAAHCLARTMLQKGAWTAHHVHYSGYTYVQLLPLLQLILECCEEPTKHHAAIYDKYLDKRYKCASRFVSNEMRRGFRLPDAPLVDARLLAPFSDYGLWNSEKFAVHQ